jgi:catechol 2,3-dioxygenase-like lactoylglutathione lyase family enzyme
MTVQPYMHLGLLVHDLDAAVARFSEVLNLTFAQPNVAHVDHMEEDGKVEPVDVRLTYSQQGPPYYELIETHTDGIYGKQHGEGLHHIGLWEPDCEARLDTLKSRGLEPEAIQYTAKNRIAVVYFRPTGLHGVRMEIIDQAHQPSIEEWINGGVFRGPEGLD